MAVLSQDHSIAQSFSSEAEMLFKAGRLRDAREKYREAASYEKRALAAIDSAKSRTKGIIAVSAASLLYKARMLDEAENLLFSLLADRTLLPPHRAQLRELLEVVWDEQALPSGTNYSGEEIWVALRGKSIGSGTAPLDMALTKSAEIEGLICRTAELVNGNKLRKHGSPSPEIQSFIQARVTQPFCGSYRFAIRLVEPEQMEMFDRKRLSAKKVSSTLFDVLRATCSSKPEAVNELRRLVPDEDYRRAMVRLIRNVAPANEAGLREVELTHVCNTSSDSAAPETFLLAKGIRPHLGEVLKRESPPAQHQEAELRGILRALHLDKNWLIISSDQCEYRCETPNDVLDDLVGPMVNREVLVRGAWETEADKKVFRLREIDLASSSF